MLAAAGGLDQIGRTLRSRVGRHRRPGRRRARLERRSAPAPPSRPCAARRSAASAAARWACTPPSRTPTTGCGSSASTSRRSTSGSSSAARERSIRRARRRARAWLEQHAARRPLRRRAPHAGAARAPDPLLLRDARTDRRVEPRLLRHQGPARADRHTSPRWTSPRRSSTTPTTGTARRTPHVCATEADMDGALTMQILKIALGHAGAVRRRAPLPRRPGRLGSLQLRPARRPGSRRAATTRREPAHVHLYPEVFYFPAGGASVQHLAAPGRLHLRAADPRPRRRYRMQVAARRARAVRRRDQRAADAGLDLRMAARLRPTRAERRRDPRPLRLEPHPRRPRRRRRASCGPSADLLDVDFDGFGAPSEPDPARHRHRHLEHEGRAGRRDRRGDRPHGGRSHTLSHAAARMGRARRERVWWDEIAGIARELLADGRARRSARGLRERDRAVRARPRRAATARCGRRSSTASTPGPRREIDELDRRARARNAILDALRIAADQPGGRPEAAAGCAATSPTCGGGRAAAHGELLAVLRLTGEYVLDHHSASQCDPLYDLEPASWDDGLGRRWSRRISRCPGCCGRPRSPGVVSPAAAAADRLLRGHAGGRGHDRRVGRGGQRRLRESAT